jgi:hypothetical protein
MPVSITKKLSPLASLLDIKVKKRLPKVPEDEGLASNPPARGSVTVYSVALRPARRCISRTEKRPGPNERKVIPKTGSRKAVIVCFIFVSPVIGMARRHPSETGHVANQEG